MRSESEKREMSTTWAMGIDYCVFKCGKKWKTAKCFGNFPLFKTKKEAYKTITDLVLSL